MAIAMSIDSLPEKGEWEGGKRRGEIDGRGC